MPKKVRNKYQTALIITKLQNDSSTVIKTGTNLLWKSF